MNVCQQLKALQGNYTFLYIYYSTPTFYILAFFIARNFSFISFDEVLPLKYSKNIMYNPVAKVMTGKNKVLEARFQKLAKLSS